MTAVTENKKLWRRCLKYLCRICGHHRLLPASYKLTSGLRKGDRPIGNGGFAEVWKGSYNGRQVAIKVLKVYETSDMEDIGRVSCWPTNKRQRIHESTFTSGFVGRS